MRVTESAELNEQVRVQLDELFPAQILNFFFVGTCLRFHACVGIFQKT